MRKRVGWISRVQSRRCDQRKRQAGIVLLGFNRVDGLARHREPLREVGLRPVPLRAQNRQATVHEYFRFARHSPA